MRNYLNRAFDTHRPAPVTAAAVQQPAAMGAMMSGARTLDRDSESQVVGRDTGIDTMRGIAILMVIGIHALPQPLLPAWETLVDAALRPSVPVFLFATGYLTARAGRVPLAKRIRMALIPYAIAFVAAYIYMALHNPAMDHRVTTTVARFVLAYVFVYYYVFVYIGCTVALWLVFRLAEIGAPETRQRLAVLLAMSIGLGLIVGSYLDPLMQHLGYSDSLIQEARLRDIPFWFGFAALGALLAISDIGLAVRDMRTLLAGAAGVTYVIYATIRLSDTGDAADYDSVAFFGYAALFSTLLFALPIRLPFLAAIGSGSYFIYLWHIFVIMILRDHAGLRELGPVADFAITFMVTAVISVAALLAIRMLAPPRLSRWLGA
ncbi:acyltransferase [Afipia sp. Root123D2]|uniref:acyltransferase family protein n=1 Tax=Afipia sp. Root123D2 TaxID=1736436 RepID=UPI000A6AFCF5|nr:acyltransferase [Afipia sp. Root123D2]